MKFLIESGVELNTVDVNGVNALSYAFFNENKITTNRIVKLLIKAGIDVNSKNRKNSVTPLLSAAYRIQSREHFTKIESVDLDTVKALIDAKADMNTPGLWRAGPSIQNAPHVCSSLQEEF